MRIWSRAGPFTLELLLLTPETNSPFISYIYHVCFSTQMATSGNKTFLYGAKDGWFRMAPIPRMYSFPYINPCSQWVTLVGTVKCALPPPGIRASRTLVSIYELHQPRQCNQQNSIRCCLDILSIPAAIV